MILKIKVSNMFPEAKILETAPHGHTVHPGQSTVEIHATGAIELSGSKISLGVGYIFKPLIKGNVSGTSWRCSGEESTFQCTGCGFSSRVGS